ncbi:MULTISPECIES: class I SAM-dependent methyltransferase [unclassified Undibacterium]|uniref:class I SAM-dependent methyltransferase n=1 Tax=unclassified Undibacterium TaxID=2630295 RepID=UPI002AC97A82|nr:MULTISPECIES: SAM-dependent methyltransferase [unclassified Undibacterium]MEB0137412.1 SAM-dependent methyltransferase [Undibacterium sp. CCC2.1]MEB0170923.1 SAM-dependent methyltransferase [Undibacterium sp. CCC1.1]MEB0174875.1 SAM-dependent methyltransferase [Undibacterium sp. CCC3.4]MEB0214211.1 SAM-dependent methyltransferase [Undibacterium sp. 5I2]WPX44522.1 SAM-dependent methyltransferase [Undibacterium sp. CCC3.4]
MQKLSLPLPASDALAASQALQQVIIEEIRAAAGSIPFSRYMELALYAPDLGYYSGGATKLGKDGDFTTAPEMSPLFAAALATLAAPILAQTQPQVMEFGAGSGKLARDFLIECHLSGITIERYFIVELSGELRARQEDLLKDYPQVQWLQQMPPAFSGLVLGNEVLDAMPVDLLLKTTEGWHELGVAESADATRLIYRARGNGLQLAQQIPAADLLPEGYVTEVHTQAIGFMHSVAQMLCAGRAETGLGGAALWIDYGFPAHEYYHPQRNEGSLMCHYRHHAHPDPFYYPGLQDITAHVDFSAIARAALEAGLELLSYTSQAALLLESGIADLLARTDAQESLRYLPQANALQKLVSPAEMGELFKALIVGTGIDVPVGLLRHDRCHRL